MTFTVNWNNGPAQCGSGNQQVWHGCLNIIHEFVQSIGGWTTLSDRDDKNTPKLQGITEWSEKKYDIKIEDKYTTRVDSHATLSPNPMDTLEKSIYCRNGPAYIPYDSFDPPWGLSRYYPTKDELQLFIDPVFVGPRSKADQKFFQSQRIKLGLRKKYLGQRSAYGSCQTPELRRWQEDVSTSESMFAAGGLEYATEWATDRGWKEGRFWTTTHLIVDNFDITLPGCEDKPESYEKLLFVMRFAGKN